MIRAVRRLEAIPSLAAAGALVLLLLVGSFALAGRGGGLRGSSLAAAAAVAMIGLGALLYASRPEVAA
jgi:hypothetical protein